VGERVNMLLVGIDSGVGRDHALTDSMVVVSIDPGSGAAMLSIPRDLVNAPLPNGEPYPRKLNSLLQTASADTAGYPFGGGVATLKGTISELLGVPIHYLAAVDMAGFQQLIDSLGGVDVDVSRPIADPTLELYIEPGRTSLSGEMALRYVRSRYGPGDDDFVRAARQQEVLNAVREKLTRTNLLTALPSLLDAVQSTVASDVPSSQIPQLAQVIQDADMENLRRVVLQPPDYVTPATGTGGAYVLLPNLELIRELGQQLMGD
jgi:LCP family protein required for cell wall assembly